MSKIRIYEVGISYYGERKGGRLAGKMVSGLSIVFQNTMYSVNKYKINFNFETESFDLNKFQLLILQRLV